MSEFSVLKHELVPEHHLVLEKDEAGILKKIHATKEQLPKIRKSDPVIIALEDIFGEIKEGRIVRIIRKSPTAGVSEAFRIVASN
jgi:DNA-directed RNA polymerase subunit H